MLSSLIYEDIEKINIRKSFFQLDKEVTQSHKSNLINVDGSVIHSSLKYLQNVTHPKTVEKHCI